MVTKAMIRDYVKNKIATDDRWQTKALIKIYNLQTSDEQATEHTTYHNCVGFTGHDAPYLSSLARQLRDKGWLSTKQKIQLKKIMPKYWKQIVDISDHDKLREQVAAAQPVIQMEMKI